MDHLQQPENFACLEKARVIYSAGFFITGEFPFLCSSPVSFSFFVHHRSVPGLIGLQCAGPRCMMPEGTCSPGGVCGLLTFAAVCRLVSLCGCDGVHGDCLGHCSHCSQPLKLPALTAAHRYTHYTRAVSPESMLTMAKHACENDKTVRGARMRAPDAPGRFFGCWHSAAATDAADSNALALRSGTCCSPPVLQLWELSTSTCQAHHTPPSPFAALPQPVGTAPPSVGCRQRRLTAWCPLLPPILPSAVLPQPVGALQLQGAVAAT